MALRSEKWSWATVHRRLQQGVFGRQREHETEDNQQDELDSNPWLSLQPNGGQEPSHVGTESSSAATPGTERHASPRWLTAQSSPYGFADDDGTLKQVDGANWRKMFGATESKRFVPNRDNKRWQTNSGPGAKSSVSHSEGTWLLQTVAAMVLVAAGIYAHNTKGELSTKIEGWYASAFSADYSNVALPAVQQFLANHHIALPVFQGNAGAIKLHVPLSGKVIEDYSATHPEMYIQGKSDETVLAAGSGTVIQVAKVNGGSMVVIDHGKIGTTTYAGLGDVSVNKGQAVSSGEAIGHLAKANAPVLHFALQKDGHSVNPHDFIVFSDDTV